MSNKTLTRDGSHTIRNMTKAGPSAIKARTNKCIQEISAILDSTENDVAKLFSIGQIVGAILPTVNDLRFHHMARLFDESLMADRLRKINFDRAIKGIKQAVQDYKQGNTYQVQYLFTAYYRSPEWFTDIKDTSQTKTIIKADATEKVTTEGNLWLQGLPKQKTLKVAEYEVSCSLKGASIQGDLVDSQGKLIDELGESPVKRKF